MYKEPVANVVGLKALAWDLNQNTFVSPARPSFTWSPGGLQMCNCEKCGNEPKATCTCGLYATFDLDIALEYIEYSPISPIFLTEASGVTHIYSYGFRSEELTIHAVAPNSEERVAMLAASQASDYFQVPVTPIDSMIILMDLLNRRTLREEYVARSKIVSGMDNAQVFSLLTKVEGGQIAT